jgi:hypothetical protein
LVPFIVVVTGWRQCTLEGQGNEGGRLILE